MTGKVRVFSVPADFGAVSWPLRLFAVTLAVRLAALAVLEPEVWEYEDIALNLLAGKGFVSPHPGATGVSYSLAEPLYPLLVALVYRVAGHSYLALGIVQAIVGACLAPAVYAVGRRLVSGRAAVVASLLVAFNPALSAYVAKFHPLLLDSLLLTLVLLLALKAREAADLRSALGWGAVLGACVLTRPTVLAFLPFACVWLGTRLPVAKAAWLSAAAIGVMLALIAPWIVRNYRIHQTFVLTRTSDAYVFWVGNNPRASGSNVAPDGTPVFELAPVEFRTRVLATDEIGQRRMFWEAGLAYVKSDPVAFVTRTLKKLYYFWWSSPQAGLSYAKWKVTIYRAYYTLALALALLGIAFAFCRSGSARLDGILLVLAFLLAVSVAQSLYIVEGRHRLAIEGVLFILSGHGLVSALARGRRVQP